MEIDWTNIMVIIEYFWWLFVFMISILGFTLFLKWIFHF